MVYGVSLASCDKASDAVPEGTLTDVTIGTSEMADQHSRTIVTADGVTRWAVGDVVKVVDVDQTPREFAYKGSTTAASGQFKGQLLSGKGLKWYYAYYGSEAVPCPSGGFYCLEIDYADMDLLNPNSTAYGQYCPMVAIPVKFDADNPVNAGFEFHHVTSLIEASIASTGKGSEFEGVNFDKVVFELKAVSGSPFNSNINMDMKQIQGKPDVDIVYSEATSGKLSTLTTTLSYSSAQNLAALINASDTDCYSIPIYALPTKTTIACFATVTFTLDGKNSYVLEKRGEYGDGGKFGGLMPSGLNVLSFNEGDILSSEQ